MLVVGDVAHDRLAVAGVGPQVLGLAVEVVRDHGVGGAEDASASSGSSARAGSSWRRGSPLELAGCCGSSRRGRRRSTGRRRRRRTARPAAPARRSRQPTSSRTSDVLRVVGVLVLVDQHVPEAAPVVLGDVGERLQQVDRGHDQVVEVDGVGLAQPALVERVRLGQRSARGGWRPARRRPRRRSARSSGCETWALNDRGGVALGVEVELAADQRHQPLRRRPSRRS